MFFFLCFKHGNSENVLLNLSFFIDLLYFFLNAVDIFPEKQDNLILTASDK